MALQALKDLFQPTTGTDTGQSMPTSDTDKSSSSTSSGLAPAGLTGGGFNTDTLASLLGSQESGSTPGSQLVDSADSDGDGTVTIEELAASLQTDTSNLTDSFGEIDSDGDGKITGEEMDNGLKAMFEKNMKANLPSEADLASELLASLDSDEGGSLSLDEILAALGEEDTSSVSDSFASYDADGDQALSSEELSSAIEAMISRQLAAYGAQAGTSGTTTSVAA